MSRIRLTLNVRDRRASSSPSRLLNVLQYVYVYRVYNLLQVLSNNRERWRMDKFFLMDMTTRRVLNNSGSDVATHLSEVLDRPSPLDDIVVLAAPPPPAACLSCPLWSLAKSFVFIRAVGCESFHPSWRGCATAVRTLAGVLVNIYEHKQKVTMGHPSSLT